MSVTDNSPHKNILDKIKRNPPNQYVNNQFNICPNKIKEYIDTKIGKYSSIVDFGCGHGIKALSLALSYPNIKVTGIDITDAFNVAKNFANKYLHMPSLPENLIFIQIDPGQSIESVAKPDIIYSWSVLEHVDKELLPVVIRDMYHSISNDGIVFTQIAPLYYSPFGSHLREYIEEPWAHLKLSHADLQNEVERKNDTMLTEDQKKRRRWMFEKYTELNKVTAYEMEKYFDEAGFVYLHKEIVRCNHKPSEQLQAIYTDDALNTNELLFITSKQQRKKVGRSPFRRLFALKSPGLG